MKAEIRERWTAALRSGDYEQGKGSLEKAGKYCCLGVLCELAVIDRVITKRTADSFIPYVLFDGADSYLTGEVTSWAGLDYANPAVPVTLLTEEERRLLSDRRGRTHISLAFLNDTGMPFERIAELIEAGLVEEDKVDLLDGVTA